MKIIKNDTLQKYLIPYEKYMNKTLKPSFIFNFSEVKPSFNHLGGQPLIDNYRLLPKDYDGNNLHLLAQLDFSSIQLPAPFPTSGILQFFVNEHFGQTFSPIEEEQYFIQFIASPSFKQTVLDDVSEESFFIVPKTLFFNGVINFEPISALDYRFEQTFQTRDDIITDDEQTFHDIYMKNHSGAEFKIGGYPYFIEKDFRTDTPTLQKYDTLLLQIISDDELPLIYRDSGIISFFIEEEKLKNLDFSDVYMHTDSY